ncbi:MAG: hypothetical protein V5A68_04560 [Candidatus Thermoplasmatota archaeon]
MNNIEYVKIRLGGIPLNSYPPFNYQAVFSLEGLINEYIENAKSLRQGKIIYNKAMTEIENLSFPESFGKMKLFITLGRSIKLN